MQRFCLRIFRLHIRRERGDSTFRFIFRSVDAADQHVPRLTVASRLIDNIFFQLLFAELQRVVASRGRLHRTNVAGRFAARRRSRGSRSRRGGRRRGGCRCARRSRCRCGRCRRFSLRSRDRLASSRCRRAFYMLRLGFNRRFGGSLRLALRFRLNDDLFTLGRTVAGSVGKVELATALSICPCCWVSALFRSP